MTRLLHRLAACGLLAAALAGCSSTRTMASAPEDARPAMRFLLSAEQADRLLATAMTGEFPGNVISRVEFPNKGVHHHRPVPAGQSPDHGLHGGGAWPGWWQAFTSK